MVHIYLVDEMRKSKENFVATIFNWSSDIKFYSSKTKLDLFIKCMKYV